MTSSSKKSRIIFIDLMRAFAVLQMVQGHTVDTLLANDYRSFESPVFVFWYFMRGLTAPVFLFTAGVVFTYLFRLHKESFWQNPRTKKGIKRFFLLVFIGYLLRYPTASIIDFSSVSEIQWRIFLAVDVLHTIGFGILFVMIFAYLSEKIKLNDYIIFGLASLIIFWITPLFQTIDWAEFLPVPIAGYFYKGTGSQFPLFPWTGYVVGGAVLGSYLANNPFVFKSKTFSINLFIYGTAFTSFAVVMNIVIMEYFNYSIFWDRTIYFIFLRLGLVLILNSIVSFISLNVESIPKLIILIGRNTLLIYVVHLVILYGSAWNPGLNQSFEKSLDVWKTVGIASAMILTMTLMVIVINKLKIKSKQLVG